MPVDGKEEVVKVAVYTWGADEIIGCV